MTTITYVERIIMDPVQLSSFYAVGGSLLVLGLGLISVILNAVGITV